MFEAALPVKAYVATVEYEVDLCLQKTEELFAASNETLRALRTDKQTAAGAMKASMIALIKVRRAMRTQKRLMKFCFNDGT